MNSIKDIENPSHSQCLKAVRAGGSKEFIYVAPELQNEEMCLRAVMDNGLMLSRVRTDLKTPRVYKAAAERLYEQLTAVEQCIDHIKVTMS